MASDEGRLTAEEREALWRAVDSFVDRHEGLAWHGHGYLDLSRCNRIIVPAIEALVARREREAAARALREAAEDQESMLLDGMDGACLLVDCGHFGHEDGMVHISSARPTDVSRWARDWLRARAEEV